MAYNALDNRQLAISLREQLILEISDIQSSMEYNEATGGREWTIDDSRSMEAVMSTIQETVNSLSRYISTCGEN